MAFINVASLLVVLLLGTCTVHGKFMGNVPIIITSNIQLYVYYTIEYIK